MALENALLNRGQRLGVLEVRLLRRTIKCSWPPLP